MITTARTISGTWQPLIISDLYNVDVQDLDILFWPLLVCPDVLDLMDHIQTLNSTSEYSMLVVQP